jgi:SagB-type dehydrogenase family enzyme
MAGNKIFTLSFLFTIFFGVTLFGCQSNSFVHITPLNVSEKPPQEIIHLPTPAFESGVSLEEALTHRRSIRDFSAETISTTEISQLMWALQGITDQAGHRTAPSAGALYPLEIYLLTVEGMYHYLPHGHQLTLNKKGDYRRGLYEAALEQVAILNAPAVFVITAVYERTSVKYGEDRSPRYVHLEAGHAAQNLLLQATALGLGGVPIGAFYDEQVKDVLSLPPDQQPLYIIPVGHLIVK